MIDLKGKSFTTNQKCLINAINKGGGKAIYSYSPAFVKTARSLKNKGLITFTYTTQIIRLQERIQAMAHQNTLFAESSDAQQLFEGYLEQLCDHCGAILQVDTENSDNNSLVCTACGHDIVKGVN